MPLYYSQSYRKSRVFTEKQGKKTPKKQQFYVTLIGHYHNKTKKPPIYCGNWQNETIICLFHYFFGNIKNSLTSDIYCGILFRRDERSLFFVLQTFSHTVTVRSREVENMRTRITLACTECKNRNYDTKKDKKTHPDRMETKKYCRFCKKHTLHKETK